MSPDSDQNDCVQVELECSGQWSGAYHGPNYSWFVEGGPGDEVQMTRNQLNLTANRTQITFYHS